MNLPPLPTKTRLAWGYTAEQMQAYGQQCREAALEEAAMAVYEWVQYQYGFAKAEEATAEIRRLK